MNKKEYVETITNEAATNKVNELKDITPVNILAEMIDISKMTLYVRLKTKKWTLKERLIIEKL